MHGRAGNIRMKNIRKGFEKNWNLCGEPLRDCLKPIPPRVSRDRIAYNKLKNAHIEGE